MSVNDIKIPSGTLAELRGALVRCLSRENLSFGDKIAIRKSQSSSSLKIHYTWNSSIGGKRQFRSVFIQMLLWCEREKKSKNSGGKIKKSDSKKFSRLHFFYIC